MAHRVRSRVVNRLRRHARRIRDTLLRLRVNDPDLTDYQRMAVARFTARTAKTDRLLLEVGSDLDCRILNALAARPDRRVCGLNMNPAFPRGTVRHATAHPIRGSGSRMPFPSDTFDAILSVATLEHVADVKTFLEECHRVLRPGGLFFIQFGPIWSSARGHHIWVARDGLEVQFSKPETNPVPDFAHLLLDEEEMRALLEDGACDPRLIDPILQWIYHRSDINRVSYEEYKRLFDESPFLIKRFRRLGRSRPDARTARALTEKYGRGQEFRYGNIEAIAYKEADTQEPSPGATLKLV